MAHLRRSAEAARFIWTLRRLGRRPFRADDVPAIPNVLGLPERDSA
jgi:hypothetical protein